MTRNLSLRENVIHENIEHSCNNGFKHLEQSSIEQNGIVQFEVPSDDTFEPGDAYDDNYDDPFETSDNSGYDKEVEIINLNNRVSREFSLSQYDVNVRQFQHGFQIHSHRDDDPDNGDISPTEDYEDDFEESDHNGEDIEDEYHSEGDEVIVNGMTNEIYYQGEVTRNEDTGSGHVICDCEDCINQAEAVDCQCENCVQTRDRTIEVSLSPEPREVTCYCEDCVTHWKDPNYSCNCEHCMFDRENRLTLNNNQAKQKCICAECVAQTGRKTDLCNCEKCNQSAVWSHDHPDIRSQRSPPQGSSQEYHHLDLKLQDEHQSDKSFDSGTEHSYRSSRSKGSYSDTSNRTRGSHSDYSSIHKGSDENILSKQLGSVQLNDSNEVHDDEYLNSRELVKHDYNLCSDKNCIKCIKLGHGKGDNLHLHENGVADVSFEADENCQCEDCQPSLPERHLMSSLLHEDITPLLENQLQKAEGELKKKTGDYDAEIKELRKENDKQHKLIQQSLSLTSDAKIEATMQHEITRLTAENLDLREVIDKQADQIRKLKKMLKVYAKRMKDGEAAEIQAELEREETKSVENVAQIKHRERNYLGMLEYKKEDETPLIKVLILDLKPKVASGFLPGLPAYLLFMCVRQTDYVNDDEKVRSFLTSTINGIKKVVKKHHDDIERVTLWLANTCRFLHTLKQYSGEKQFQTENTPRQNEHCLRNFDLAEYRQVFSDLAVWIYQTLIKLLEATIQPSIVSAVLEHEAIAGLTGSKPSGLRGRSSSRAEDTPEHSLDTLMKSMNMFVRVLTQHAVDPELTKQIFRQLYYFLGASALNNLLLRKDMCNWSKGMQIRYNLSHLEQWLRDNKLQESGAGSTLEPIVQASQLLQARKTDADVESVYEMCSKLTAPQIVKILNLYTPVDEFEERVPISFIRKIQQKLKERDHRDTSLLMDLKFSYSVTFPFNPSKISLESIEVPEQLHLGNLVTRS